METSAAEISERRATEPGPRVLAWVMPARRYGLAWRKADRYVMAIAALAFVLVVASNLGSLAFDHLRTSVINANWQYSWSHDVDTVLLAVGVLGGLAGARTGGKHRPIWAATAGILALLVIDELSPFHGKLRNLDKLLYAPILVALVVCVWRLTAASHERVLVRWGLLALTLAFVMHVGGLHLLRPLGYTNYVYQAGVGFKEGTELAGLVLLVTALWRRASR